MSMIEPVYALCSTDEACNIISLFLLSFPIDIVLISLLLYSLFLDIEKELLKICAIISFIMVVWSLYVITAAMRPDLIAFPLFYTAFVFAFMFQRSSRRIKFTNSTVSQVV